MIQTLGHSGPFVVIFIALFLSLMAAHVAHSVVWACFGSYAHWPAQVCEEYELLYFGVCVWIDE